MSFSDSYILVVDDDKIIRENLSKYLNLHQIPTLMAEEGKQALSIFNSSKVALLITDINMPNGMDGFELISNIRKIQPNLPILVMSGYIENETSIDKMNDVFFFQKPFSSKLLTQKVKELLKL